MRSAEVRFHTQSQGVPNLRDAIEEMEEEADSDLSDEELYDNPDFGEATAAAGR